MSAGKGKLMGWQLEACIKTATSKVQNAQYNQNLSHLHKSIKNISTPHSNF